MRAHKLRRNPTSIVNLSSLKGRIDAVERNFGGDISEGETGGRGGGLGGRKRGGGALDTSTWSAYGSIKSTALVDENDSTDIPLDSERRRLLANTAANGGAGAESDAAHHKASTSSSSSSSSGTGTGFKRYGATSKTPTAAEADGFSTMKLSHALRPESVPAVAAPVEPRLWDHLTADVLVVLLMYTVLKIGQELTASSIPLLTGSIFGWSMESAGYYMAVMGALVLPVNILVNELIKDVEDRAMLLRLVWVCLASILFACHFSFIGEYSLVQYILGTGVLFACLNSLEGINMNLLARLISPELAKGTFNSGLLATEAGTFGRVIGDFCITLFGYASVPADLVNKLFLPLFVMLVGCLLVVEWYFDRLV
jgi:hypothetical protein